MAPRRCIRRDGFHQRITPERGSQMTVRPVLEVADLFCPWNGGRYTLETGEDGSATVEGTTDEPDLSCTVSDVGAAYLGGTSFRGLARAGRVEERTGGALATADAMFGWDPAPWSPYDF